MKQKDYPLADWGDYLKLTACTAVILQSVLGLAINLPLSKAAQVGIGFTYDLVKFTAPAFIFGILFTTIRLRTAVKQSYWQYLRQQWSALFLPSICWTIIYLVGLPQLQQIQHYHNFSSFIWQFFNGNAAPHLWYNTMMLQFIILMPLFWWLAVWCRQRPARAWLTVIVTVVFAGSWLLGYQYLVGSRPEHWYLLDRIWLSFVLFAILGVLTSLAQSKIAYWLKKLRYWLLAGWGLTYLWTGWQLFRAGLPIKLSQASYYQLSMTIYDLLVIGLIILLAEHQRQQKPTVAQKVHWLAGFAYKAYLANVFWAVIWWQVGGRQLTLLQPAVGIIGVYLLTWLSSYATAIGLKALVGRVQNVFELRLKKEK